MDGSKFYSTHFHMYTKYTKKVHYSHAPDWEKKS